MTPNTSTKDEQERWMTWRGGWTWEINSIVYVVVAPLTVCNTYLHLHRYLRPLQPLSPFGCFLPSVTRAAKFSMKHVFPTNMKTPHLMLVESVKYTWNDNNYKYVAQCYKNVLNPPFKVFHDWLFLQHNLILF